MNVVSRDSKKASSFPAVRITFSLFTALLSPAILLQLNASPKRAPCAVACSPRPHHISLTSKKVLICVIIFLKKKTHRDSAHALGLLETLISHSFCRLPWAGTLRPAPPLLRCSTRPAPKTLSESHTSRRSSVFRDKPENVGRQSQQQAAQGHRSRRRTDAAAGDLPLTQGGDAPLVDGGKGGGHRRADSRCFAARPPASH